MIVGWVVAVHVSHLRLERYGTGPEAETARAAFGPWHGVSLGLQFLTVALVLALTVLAARLPLPQPDAPSNKAV